MFFLKLVTVALFAVCLANPAEVRAQQSSEVAEAQQQVEKPAAVPEEPQTEPESGERGDLLTMFPHSESSRWWISGQANIILQWHGDFFAKYSGPNSLHARGENATSRVLTLATGFAITPTTELLVDIETAGGRGISDAFGLVGCTVPGVGGN